VTDVRAVVIDGFGDAPHLAVDEVQFAERGLHGSNVSSFPDRALLERLAGLAASGGLRTVITGRYTLDEAPAALAEARDGHTRGKLVIEVAG
jgi:NADPH:quinone reductase-like Zn-dependent oxidoreductase